MLIPLVHGVNHSDHGRILTEIAELVDAGRITPILDENEFSIWDVAKAHAHFESGKSEGKITLAI